MTGRYFEYETFSPMTRPEIEGDKPFSKTSHGMGIWEQYVAFWFVLIGMVVVSGILDAIFPNCGI